MIRFIFFFLLVLPLQGYAQSTDPELNKTLSEAKILENIKKAIKPVELKESITPGSGKINASSKSSDDTNENIYTLTSQAYKAAQIGQLEAAVMLYKKALKLEPDNTYVLFSLGAAYQALHQYEDAKNTYGQLLAIDSNNQQAINNYLSLVAKISPARALKYLQELEKVNNNFSPVKAQIGMIYANIGEYALAESYLRKAITISPEIINYRYNLAILYDKMDRYNEAIHIYKQVLSFGGNELSSSTIIAIQERIKFLHVKLS